MCVPSRPALHSRKSDMGNRSGVAGPDFSVPDAHHYMPGYSGAGSGTDAQFTAYSKGDLDCDNTLAEFIRQGAVNSAGDPTGNAQPIVINELE